jgi:hypothetical protein
MAPGTSGSVPGRHGEPEQAPRRLFGRRGALRAESGGMALSYLRLVSCEQRPAFCRETVFPGQRPPVRSQTS